MSLTPPVPIAGRLRDPGRGTPAAGASLGLSAIVAVVTVVTVVAAACATTPPSVAPSTTASASASPPPSDLPPARTPAPTVSGTRAWPAEADGLVLARHGSARILELVRAGTVAPLGGPGEPIVAIRQAPSGLVAVLGDGRVSIGRGSGSSLTWRFLAGASGIAAAAAKPTGRRLALLPADRLGRGKPLRILVADPATGRSRPIDAPALEANGAPSWLADGRIVLRAIERSGRSVLAFVDPVTGRATTAPFDAIDVAVSADGSTIASVEEAAISVRRGAGAATTAVTLGQAPPGSQIGAVALDATGARIAFAWVDGDGAAAAVSVCRDPGWTCAPAMPFAAPDGLLLAWLR